MKDYFTAVARLYEDHEQTHGEGSYLRGLGRRALLIAVCITAMEVASVGIGAASPVCNPNGTITACCTATVGSSYTLGKSIALTGNAACCITLSSLGTAVPLNPTTINLNGFTIANGSSAASTTAICGPTMPFVTVQNGGVIGFTGFGINLGSSCSVTGVTVSSNGYHGNNLPSGIGIQCGDNGFIANNRATGNGSSGGIVCGNNCKIAENVASSNAQNGITCGSNCVVESNTANYNASGIVVSGAGVVSGNTANDNSVRGIIDAGGGDTVIKGNTANVNGTNGVSGVGIVGSAGDGCVDNVAKCNFGNCTTSAGQISGCTSFGAGAGVPTNLCNGTAC